MYVLFYYTVQILQRYELLKIVKSEYFANLLTCCFSTASSTDFELLNGYVVKTKLLKKLLKIFTTQLFFISLTLFTKIRPEFKKAHYFHNR